MHFKCNYFMNITLVIIFLGTSAAQPAKKTAQQLFQLTQEPAEQEQEENEIEDSFVSANADRKYMAV